MSDIKSPNYIEEVKNLNSNTFASSFLNEKINSEINWLEKNGLPTHKHEDWKYTAVQKFLPKVLNLPQKGSATTHSLDKDCYHLVFQNGFYQESLSQIPEGISIHTFNRDSVAADIPEGELLDKFSDTSTGHFNQLNLATMQEGVLLSLDANTVIDKPLKISHLNDQDHIYTGVRILLSTGTFSKVTLWEHFQNTESEIFENSVTHMIIGEGARVNYINDCHSSPERTHISLLQADIKRDAELQAYYLSYNTKLIRNNVFVNLIGENANADLRGLYTSKENAHNDQFICINHQKPHTNSNQLYKGILDGDSRGVFTGKVIVHRDAQQVNSEQLNKNLLLSKKAHVDTRPQLEVYADDVKCAHGATVGQLNPEELFYLESRGISSERAFNLLCEGFAQDVFDTIDNLDMAKHLKEELTNALKH